MILLYLSYIVLIYLILNFYKNNTKYAEIISSILICVGIYIINLVLFSKIKETFSNKNKGSKTTTTTSSLKIGDTCNGNQDCHTRYCSSSICTGLLPNKSKCTIDDECVNKHCFSKKCNSRKKTGVHCTKDRDCNEFDFKNNKYINNNYCGIDNVCHRGLKH